jgi:hypothetical protein
MVSSSNNTVNSLFRRHLWLSILLALALLGSNVVTAQDLSKIDYDQECGKWRWCTPHVYHLDILCAVSFSRIVFWGFPDGAEDILSGVRRHSFLLRIPNANIQDREQAQRRKRRIRLCRDELRLD